MMVSEDFEVAAGSIVGREHLRPFGWRNNQDSFAIRVMEEAIIAVVTDGCGSEAKSEVGATIGAAIIAESLVVEFRALGEYIEPAKLLTMTRKRTLAYIRMLANTMGQDFERVISDHFLFTVNGLVMTRRETTLFSVGDGVQFVNGERIPLGPFENNMPPYLAYTLLAAPGEQDPANDFKITMVLSTEAVQSLLVGTDGVEHLVAAESKCLPGKSEFVGSISQFWQEDRYFENPDMVRRRLALMQNEHLAIDWREKTASRTLGRLPDDTTLVTIRRKPKR